jgi:hypothetical protein
VAVSAGGAARRAAAFRWGEAAMGEDEEGEGEGGGEAKDGKDGKLRLLRLPAWGSCSGRAEEGKENGARVQPNKHRAVQLARTGGRKLFDEAAQAVFLEWFAATCNFVWSAERAGFNYKTVMRHRMEDERFRDGCNRAVEQAYARVEAKRLETRKKALPIGIEGDWDAPEMEEMSPERMDAILRAYKLEAKHPDMVRRQGRRPRIASNAEVREALVKRLAAFGIRVSKEEAEDGTDSVIASEAKQSSTHSGPAELDRRGADAPRDDDLPAGAAGE